MLPPCTLSVTAAYLNAARFSSRFSSLPSQPCTASSVSTPAGHRGGKESNGGSHGDMPGHRSKHRTNRSFVAIDQTCALSGRRRLAADHSCLPLCLGSAAASSVAPPLRCRHPAAALGKPSAAMEQGDTPESRSTAFHYQHVVSCARHDPRQPTGHAAAWVEPPPCWSPSGSGRASHMRFNWCCSKHDIIPGCLC